MDLIISIISIMSSIKYILRLSLRLFEYAASNSKPIMLAIKSNFI